MERYCVLAIFATGTIVRGNPDPNSDLDLYVIHEEPFRERLQEFHHQVPCETFVNPPGKITEYFEGDRANRRPLTAHMLASGFLVFDTDQVGEALQNRAKEEFANPPTANPDRLLAARYGAATTVEDVLDVYSRDPDSALLMIGHAVWVLMEYRVACEPGWLPRFKDLPQRFKQLDPDGYLLAAIALNSAAPAERIDALRALSMRVAGASGFFEWASPRDNFGEL